MALVSMAGLTVRSIRFELRLGFLGVALAAAGCGTVRPDAAASPSAKSQSPTPRSSQSGQTTGEAGGDVQSGSQPQDANAESAVPAVHGTVIRSPSGRITAD